MISFNRSIVGRHLTDDPYQIMPVQQHYITDSLIDSFDKTDFKNVLIHTSYITRPFTEYGTIRNSKVYNNIANYIKLANKIGSKNILIHGPTSLNEMLKLGIGFNMLIEIFKDSNITLHIESPAWSNDLKKYLNDEIENVKNHPKGENWTKDKTIPYPYRKEGKINLHHSNAYHANELYFKYVLLYKNKFDNLKIVLDTAHLHSNGLSGNEMVMLFKEFKNEMEFVHLNGNANVLNGRDIHCPWMSEMNKISDQNEFMTYISTLNYILITENNKNKSTYEEWVKFANKYNLKIVKDNSNYQY